MAIDVSALSLDERIQLAGLIDGKRIPVSPLVDKLWSNFCREHPREFAEFKKEQVRNRLRSSRRAATTAPRFGQMVSCAVGSRVNNAQVKRANRVRKFGFDRATLDAEEAMLAADIAYLNRRVEMYKNLAGSAF